MKIIDFERRGNVVRFILGEDDLKDWYGDDWNDRPYEHNAGSVYPQFISGFIDVAFPFASVVTEPADDWTYQSNSPFCKDDFRERKCPCIIVVPRRDDWEIRYSQYMGSDKVERFYFGDSVEKVRESSGVILKEGKEFDEEELWS